MKTLNLDCGHTKRLSDKDAEITTSGHTIYCTKCKKNSKVV